MATAIAAAVKDKRSANKIALAWGCMLDLFLCPTAQGMKQYIKLDLMAGWRRRWECENIMPVYYTFGISRQKSSLLLTRACHPTYQFPERVTATMGLVLRDILVQGIRYDEDTGYFSKRANGWMSWCES